MQPSTQNEPAGQTPTFQILFPPGQPPERRPWSPSIGDARGSWVHVDRRDPAARAWAEGPAGLDPLAVEALFEEETRPRLTPFPGGDLLILRGVNTTPGADPEDMISIRIWIEPDRVISVSGLRLLAVDDVVARYVGPERNVPETRLDPGALVARLATRLGVRARDAVRDIDDGLDAIEEAVLNREVEGRLEQLLNLRRRAIWLRRYLAPQFEALEDLAELERPWLSDRAAQRITEAANLTLRLTEALDALRDHATVIQEQLAAISAERTNRTLYILTVAAAIFLPVNLLAALLGANVGGIPGAESPYGFAILTLISAIMVAVEIWFLRRLRLL